MFRTIPSADGVEISQTTVYDIKKSGDGFVWIATDDGLIRFDGEHSMSVPLPASENGSSAVKSIAPIPGDGLLVGTDNILYRLTVDKGSYKVETLLDGKPFSATCGISTASGDAIIGGDDGLVVFSCDSNKVSRVKLSDNVLNRSNSVIDMSQSPNAVYVLTKGGIFRYDKTTHGVSPVKSNVDIGSLSPTSLTCSEDHLYVGTSGEGVLSLNPIDGEVAHTQYVVTGNVVTSLDMSGDRKKLYVGTDGGGVTKVDLSTGKTTVYRHRSADPISPSSNQVYSLLVDSQGLLWIGYYQHGLDYTPESVGPFELYDNSLVFNSRGTPVRALYIDSVYSAVGTREGVVMHDKAKEDVWEVGSPYLRSEMVISLFGSNGKILVGTYGGGMQVIDPKTRRVSDFAAAKDDPVFRNGHVFSIASDNHGGIWAGTNDGLYYFDADGKVAHFTSYLTALPEGNVYGIFFDSEGKGWICTDSGICIYDPERKMLRTDLFPVSFPKDTRFRSVYEDSHRRLYFVPESGYVYTCGLDFSNPRTLDYPLLEGSDAKSVVEDSYGDIWISTNRGIFRTDSTGHTMRFGLSSGLPSVSFLQAQPMPDGAGGIWFGNAEGLLRLDEKAIEASVKRRCPPVPTKVTVNGSPVDMVPEKDDEGVYVIDFDSFANNIKIGFSTFSYAIEEPEAYEYSIDDSPWTHFKGGMSASFYDLSPGRHILRVRSASDSDNPDLKETVVRLDLPYPFMWKAVFWVVVALVVLCVFLVCRSIVHHRRLKNLPAAAEAATAETAAAEEEAPRQKKYVSNTLTRNEAREIAAKIERIMEKEKPYLQPDLKVGKLAEMVGISSHKLSQFFSQHKDISFYDYVNKYRVEEFKRMVKDEDVKNLTLSAMAERAGFSSRASFFRYFKNIEGISPGEYLKSRQ